MPIAEGQDQPKERKEKFVNHIGRCTVELPALVS
jgi:hypothetical protein